MLSTFHVIGVVSNPVRFQSRYKLAKDFMRRMAHDYPEVVFHVAETAFGNRPFEVTDANHPRHYQFRSTSELWQKESMINLVMQRLPDDWEYVAWVDMDIAFSRGDVFLEAWHQLQHYSVIQLFSDCVDLGPKNELIQAHKSFCFIYQHNRRVKTRYEFAHPGFAWAARRDAMEGVHGLIDEAALGAGDHHMALAMVGKGHLSYPSGIHPDYKKMVLDWQERAEKTIQRNIGYVPGLIYHFWHGKKKDRKYIERWDILVKDQFDPDLDLKRNRQGLLELTDHNIKLRDDIREYFRQRNEDSVDLE